MPVPDLHSDSGMIELSVILEGRERSIAFGEVYEVYEVYEVSHTLSVTNVIMTDDGGSAGDRSDPGVRATVCRADGTELK